MRIFKLYFIVIFVVAISLIASCSVKSESINLNEEKSYFYNSKDNLQCIYYDERNFVNVKDFKLENNIGSIQGCILPHHLTASDLIHKVFQNINKNEYDTVVLIGPDHESIQMGKIFTTIKDWQTPFGILDTNEEITKELIKNNFVLENDEKLAIEHSISSIIPFIKYYLDDVNVVTLAITKQTKIESVEKLIKDICSNINWERTLFIASVDFSHYLDLENANKMDNITMYAIENRDLDKIMSFDNDYLDSPISIVTLLKLMNKLNAQNKLLLNHSNTELIIKMKMQETTSYLTYLFY